MQQNNIIFYKTSDSQIQVQVEWENIWMNQDQIAKLFGRSRNTITEHINNIYSDWELLEEKTLQKIANVGKTDIGNNKPTKYYSIELIFAVGYRVRSSEIAISFRNWATSVLKEYALRWFVMDDQRMIDGNTLNGKVDFDALLERVRNIRFSEKQIYEKIKDLFTTSTDYDSKSSLTKDFFAKIQNKFIFAITGHTTAELIVERVSAQKQALWMKGAQKNRITKKEATTGKNYLLEKELKQLYLLCEQFFSFAELQVSLEREIYMKDWVDFLNDILKMNKLEILENAGKVSNEKMKEVVEKEIIKYQENWGSLDIYIDTISEVRNISQ